MKWIEYKSRYIEVGQQIGYPQEVIDDLLFYAEKLFIKNLPVIYDQLHFSKLVGYQYELVLRISNSQKDFYREFTIPKKNGGERPIFEPLPTLKEIQKWILDNILNNVKVSPTAKAYIQNTSIKDNGKFHRKQNKLLNLDIENFFGTITEHQVYNAFKKLGYSKPVSNLMSKICCLSGSLPQGAPTSPMLSNMIFYHMDMRIFGYCKKNKIRYSRYADDMTFSGDSFSNIIITFIKKVLNENGFNLNDRKTKIRFTHQRQEVTGIVVNEKMQAKREYRRLIRQQIYYIKRFGIRDQSKINGYENPKKYLYHLLGKSNFVLFVNPKDKDMIENIKYLHFRLSEYR